MEANVQYQGARHQPIEEAHCEQLMSAEDGNRADEGAGKADGLAEPTCLVSHPRSGPAMPAVVHSRI